MNGRGSSVNSGPSFGDKPGGPPFTITDERLGRPGDDRFGS